MPVDEGPVGPGARGLTAPAACPACGRGTLEPWIEVPGGEPSDARRYGLRRCASCASAVTAGEAPGAELYESGVYAPRAPRLARLIAAIQGLAMRQPLALLRRAGLGTGARVLDAGAGRGRFVAALRAAGFDARGIDASERSVTLADAAGAPVARASIGEHDESGLDAVVLWHVLEHLDDPLAALERARSWLRPGGVVLIGVPNVASLQARIAGPGWLHFDAPRHRVHLTPDGLRTLLERSGLVPGRLHQMVWEHNAQSMWMALLCRLGMTPGLPFQLLKRNVSAAPRDLALLALAGPLLAPPALALELVAAAAGRGGTVAIVATVPS